MLLNPVEQLEDSPSDHNVLNHPDILDTMMDLLSNYQAYGSICRLACLSKYHRDIVQPRLTLLRKRIVLFLDDYVWRDKSNDENIEIIHCSSGSALPTRPSPPTLAPSRMIYSGRPDKSAFYVCRDFFPTISDVLFSDNLARAMFLEADGRPPKNSRPSWRTSVTTFNDVAQSFGTISNDNAASNLTLRHHGHVDYHQPVFTSPGQCHFIVNASTDRGLSIHREYLCKPYNVTQEFVLNNIDFTSLLPKSPSFQAVSIDCYVRLMSTSPGEFYYSEEGTTPSAHGQLSGIAEYIASAHLTTDSKSTVTLRVFIVGHGDVWQDKADVLPIYTTTCAIASTNPGRKAIIVLQRYFDDDFARCVVNNGCARCHKDEQ